MCVVPLPLAMRQAGGGPVQHGTFSTVRTRRQLARYSTREAPPRPNVTSAPRAVLCSAVHKRLVKTACGDGDGDSDGDKYRDKGGSLVPYSLQWSNTEADITIQCAAPYLREREREREQEHERATARANRGSMSPPAICPLSAFLRGRLGSRRALIRPVLYCTNAQTNSCGPDTLKVQVRRCSTGTVAQVDAGVLPRGRSERVGALMCRAALRCAALRR